MIKDKNTNQNGQSLVELIIIVPLFFIILACMNLYLNQKIKSITTDSVYQSMLISDAQFDQEERIYSYWNTSQKKDQEYKNDIILNGINSSLIFKNSIETKNGVFIDKKKVVHQENTDCKNHPNFQSRSTKNGEFEFSVCADGTGFEATSVSYQKIVEDFKSTNMLYSGKSIYYPSPEFAWHNRSDLIKNAINEFKMTLESVLFNKNYASLTPTDWNNNNNHQFNTHCLMNSAQSDCALPTLEKKWRRMAFNGANSQVIGCLSEATAKCIKLITPGAIAACVAEKSAAIATALKTGSKAIVCPILNNFVDIRYQAVLKFSHANNTKIYLQESALQNQ